MARTSDPRNRDRQKWKQTSKRRLRLLPPVPAIAAQPLPPVVPVLRPDQPITPAQDAVLTTLAHRARLGDDAARDLLWRAFAPRLEPALLRRGRTTWQPGWARRDGQPWELEDVRQEAWLVFAELTAAWDGEGSFAPYVTAYFPWRLRNAMRRLAPTRTTIPPWYAKGAAATSREQPDAGSEVLLAAIMAALSPADAEVMRLRLAEDLSLGEIARRLGTSRRTASRRWARVRRVARKVLLGDG